MSSVKKAIDILKILSEKPYEYGVTELAEKINCGKSGTHKILTELFLEGLVEQKKNKKYSLGLSSYLIGKIYEENIGIAKFCRPYLIQLRDEINENISFGMWVNGNVTLLYKEESKELVRIISKVGSTRPFYASAIGKILGAYEDEKLIKEKLMKEDIIKFTENTITSPIKILEEFKKIKNQGYSISDEEFSLNIIGIGAPIFSPDGKIWAAISIGAPKIRVDNIKLDKYIFLIVQTAEKMSKELKKYLKF